MKIKRTLGEINEEIKTHKDAIKELEKEIRDFQAECPHPENFQKVTRKSYSDEYGTTEGYTIDTKCLLCGFSKFEDEPVERSRYR